MPKARDINAEGTGDEWIDGPSAEDLVSETTLTPVNVKVPIGYLARIEILGKGLYSKSAFVREAIREKLDRMEEEE